MLLRSATMRHRYPQSVALMPSCGQPSDGQPNLGQLADRWSVECVAEIDSTNTELMERARNGAAEGQVLIADLQTAGRGRRGRSWQAPAGSALMMSLLLRPSPQAIPPNKASLVTLALALAAAEACEQVAGVRPLIKWPNDLVFEEANNQHLKVAGILAESLISSVPHVSQDADRSERGTMILDALVVGMGLNTNWTSVPAELAGIATALNLRSGHEIDRFWLAGQVLRQFEPRYAALNCGETSAVARLLAEAESSSATIGRCVTVQLDQGSATSDRSIVGLALSLDQFGHLMVRDKAGVIHAIAAGDVVHLRPAEPTTN